MKTNASLFCSVSRFKQFLYSNFFMKQHLYTAILVICASLASNNLSFGQNKLVWSDLNGKIVHANPDGTDKTTIVAGHIPYDLQVDSSTQTVYWTESGTNSIWKLNVATSATEKIFQTTEAMRGLTLDQNKLYFCTESGISKLNPDGTQPENVLNVANASDVKLINGELFWTDWANGKIWTKNASGSANTTLFSNLAYPSNLEYNAADGKLYWLEYCGSSSCTGIRKGNTTGGTKQVVINEFINGFALNNEGTKVFCTIDIDDEIFSITTSGTGRTSVQDITSTPKNIAVMGGRYYWFDLAYGDYLYSINTNGTNRKVEASSPVYRPTRFVIDASQKWVYWVNSPGAFSGDNSQGIKRARLDGSDIQNVVNKSDLDSPYGIAFDSINQKLYFTDRGDRVIRRCNTDGTGVEDIITDGAQSVAPLDIAIDVAGNRLFWTDTNDGTVKTSDLDGNQITTMVENLSYPWGIIYSPVTDEVFFCEYTGSKTIQRMPAAGGTRDTITIVTSAFERPNSITVDHANSYLYWTADSFSKLNRINLDGTNPTSLLNGAAVAGYPASVQVLPTNTVVEIFNIEVEKAVVFPNPFTDAFVLKNMQAGDRLILFNMMGQSVLSQTMSESDLFQVDASAITPGTYVLMVQHKNGKRAVQKVVKTK